MCCLSTASKVKQVDKMQDADTVAVQEDVVLDGLVVVIGDMKIGLAAQCIRILGTTAIVEFSSIGGIIRSKFIIPLLIVVPSTDEEGRMEPARRGRVGRGVVA